MSKKIIAIAADTPISASCSDGVNWVQSDSDNYRWKTIHGSIGDSFLYSVIDVANPYVLENYSTIDVGVTWTAGILPTPQLSCIIAVADDADGIFVSYNGTSFETPQPFVDIDFQRQYGGNTIYQTCSATAYSTAQVWTIINAQLFFVTCIAVANSTITSNVTRVKTVVGNAASFTVSSFDRSVTFVREFSITVSNLASSIREFIW